MLNHMHEKQLLAENVNRGHKRQGDDQ